MIQAKNTQSTSWRYVCFYLLLMKSFKDTPIYFLIRRVSKLSKAQVSKMGLGTFIGLTMALCATVRSIPTLSAVGWTLIFYTIFAVLFFAGPISMISGELSTMLSQEGGPQLWVKTALGSKWGFVVAWLLWVQMFQEWSWSLDVRPIVREYVWERRSWQQSLLRFRMYLGHLLDHHLAQLEV